MSEVACSLLKIDRDAGTLAFEKRGSGQSGPKNTWPWQVVSHGFAGKYVLDLRGNTQIDTSTDSKQVSESIVWYRLVSKGIEGGNGKETSAILSMLSLRFLEKA